MAIRVRPRRPRRRRSPQWIMLVVSAFVLFWVGFVGWFLMTPKPTVFVCITGQVSRLVLQKQMETLYRPLSWNFNLDFALLLTEQRTRYTNLYNGMTQTSEFSNFQQAVDYLEDHNYRVLSRHPIIQSDHPYISQEYFRKLDKPEFNSSYQEQRVANHARQFETLQQCANYLGNENQTSDFRYDFIIRIREDVAFNSTFNIRPILPTLRNKTSVVIGSDCRTHGGINDRLAFVSPKAAFKYFTLPYQRYRYSDKPFNKFIFNPETFFYQTYIANKIRAVNSKYVRHVIKYVRNSVGKPVPANNEGFACWCPGVCKKSR